MIRIRLATSIGIAWRIPSESGGEISGIGRRNENEKHNDKKYINN
jgi:hypothetical protein